jgi:CheY-like chemotaxis protein
LLDNISQCVFRASEITNEILVRDPKNNIKKSINIFHLLKEVFNTLKQTCSADIKLSFNDKENGIYINCFSNDIYRAVLNIGINAIEAINGPGSVQFTLDSFKIDINNQNIYNLPTGLYARITVKDNGSGITPEIITKIFDLRFSTKNKVKEYGLGLHIVKKIINEHNGYINVISELGKGTEFEILLPALDNDHKKAGTNDGKTIVIADDDDMLRELLRELLESYQYNIIEAKNGKEVLDILENSNKIDLLIIDRKMPVINGIECIKFFRQHMNIQIPTILSSGSPSVSEINVDELNINSVINKPYNFTNMLNVINSLLN